MTEVVRDKYIKYFTKECDKNIKYINEQNKKTIFGTKSLYDKKINNLKDQKARMLNIASTIPLLYIGKELAFVTTTLTPDIYLDSHQVIPSDIKNKLSLQNKAIMAFTKSLTKATSNTYLYTHETTKQFNIHQHSVSYFDNINEIENLIEKIYTTKHHKLNTHKHIGRVEIKVREKFRARLLKTFKNKKLYGHGIISIKKKTDRKTKQKFLQIVQSDLDIQRDLENNYKRSSGNIIKIAFIYDCDNDDAAIFKYLFKYLVKSTQHDNMVSSVKEECDSFDFNKSDDLNYSIDTKVLKVAHIEQIRFSNNFFISKDTINKIKAKDEEGRLKFTNELLFELNNVIYKGDLYKNQDTCLYDTIQYIKNEDIFYVDGIWYFKRDDREPLYIYGSKGAKSPKKEYDTQYEAVLAQLGIHYIKLLDLKTYSEKVNILTEYEKSNIKDRKKLADKYFQNNILIMPDMSIDNECKLLATSIYHQFNYNNKKVKEIYKVNSIEQLQYKISNQDKLAREYLIGKLKNGI